MWNWPKAETQPVAALFAFCVTTFLAVYLTSFPARCFESGEFRASFDQSIAAEFSSVTSPSDLAQAAAPASFCTWAGRWSARGLLDPIAWFSMVLTIATIGLWMSTRRLWRGAESQAADFKRSVDASQRSAEAAILHAHILVEAERGTLTLSHANKFQMRAPISDPTSSQVVLPGHLSPECFLRVVVNNPGKTRVRVITTALCWHLGSEPTREEELRLVYKQDKAIRRTVSGGGAGSEIDFDEVPLKLRPSDFINIASGDVQLWAIGYIRYEDITDIIDLRFIQRWDEKSIAGQAGRGWIGLASRFNGTRIVSKRNFEPRS